jgi:hypothetical protein
MVRRTWLPVLLLAASAPQVWAVNKCTMDDGRVVYQDAPCSNGARSSAEVKTWDGSPRSDDQRWQFFRTHDTMKGTSACVVRSPTAAAFNGRVSVNNYVEVTAVVLVDGDGPTFFLRTGSESDSFHNDVSGMGVKTDVGSFTPLPVRASGRYISVLSSANLVAELEQAKALRARVRFWPYDTLHDLQPIPMTGFKQAMRLAKLCAEKQD